MNRKKANGNSENYPIQQWLGRRRSMVRAAQVIDFQVGNHLLNLAQFHKMFKRLRRCITVNHIYVVLLFFFNFCLFYQIRIIFTDTTIKLNQWK